VRAGTPYKLVARRLGHAEVQMVAKVYGRFAPRSEERDRWEKVAAERAAAPGKVEQMRTEVGTAPRDERGQPPVGDWPIDSRGGTRTHDPGIMSAVL
jgi:hypothetical protein